MLDGVISAEPDVIAEGRCGRAGSACRQSGTFKGERISSTFTWEFLRSTTFTAMAEASPRSSRIETLLSLVRFLDSD